MMELKMFTRGHISQSLTRLQKKGYIQMEQDLEDRRCTHNYLTKEAYVVIEQVEKIYESVQDIIMKGVTEEERRILSVVAQKVNQNINEEL
jgi:DNA-binding MarR family transcriptional regulator